MKKFNQQIFDICGKKFTLQDVFETACNYLEENENDYHCNKSQFTCDCIKWAVHKEYGWDIFEHITTPPSSQEEYGWDVFEHITTPPSSQDVNKLALIQTIVDDFLIGLGFEEGYFKNLWVYSFIANPQQARFIWLTWLAMMAEEQGV